MRSPRLFLLAPAFAAAAACTAVPFDDRAIGPLRLGASGSTMFSDTRVEANGNGAKLHNEVDSYSAEVGYRFWSDVQLEPGLRASVDYAEIETVSGFNDGDTLQIALVPYLRYYLPVQGQVRPWVEGFGGVSYNDVHLEMANDDSWGPVVGASLGISAFLTQTVSIETAVRYLYREVDLAGADTSTNNYGLVLGLATWF